MKVSEHIKKANGNTLFSFEVLPPKKGDDINELFNCIHNLMPYDPAFIEVTYHREELIEVKQPDGSMKSVVHKKRPGTVGICAAIINRYQVDAVPHLICGGFTKDETENALIDLGFLGIDNILALQGDAMKSQERFVPEPDGNAYASDLVTQIQKMNHGIYLDESIENNAATNFQIGVAGYPEKHFAAASMDEDLHFLKQKVDFGAEYIVTQMFFDNAKYFEFVDKCRAIGITVPIIPGLKPLATKRQIEVLPQFFYLDFPEELKKEVLSCANNDAVKQVGIEWAIQQSKELKAAGVPVLHYYTMSKATSTAAIAKAVF